MFFAQEHRPGEAGQTDFTSTMELGITICGAALVHLLCHFVLPFSNWQWATVVRSESMLALRKGIQAAVFQLGHVPAWHQTDNILSVADLNQQVSSGEKDGNEDQCEASPQ